jgi:hypothetical protein
MESGSNAKIKHISEIIYKESVSGNFESESHIIQPVPVKW